MIIRKEVWYDVVYTDTTERKPFPRTRSFKLKSTAQSFYDKLDCTRFSKHLVLYEKSLLDFCISEHSKNDFEKNV